MYSDSYLADKQFRDEVFNAFNRDRCLTLAYHATSCTHKDVANLAYHILKGFVKYSAGLVYIWNPKFRLWMDLNDKHDLNIYITNCITPIITQIIENLLVQISNSNDAEFSTSFL